MKQLIFACLTLATVWASGQQHKGQYAPYFAHGYPNLFEYTDQIDPKLEYKVEHPAGLIFGHGFLDGLHTIGEHSGLEGFKAGPLEYTVNSNLVGFFDKELSLPEIPKPIITKGQEFSPRYTKTATTTYEVMEDNFEPKPVPTISVATPILPAQKSAAISLGSGSLGVTSLGNGNFAIGSGSLGYVGAQNSQASQNTFGGGLHEVNSPSLGSEQSHGVEDSRDNESVSLNFYEGGFSGESSPSDFNSLHAGGGIADFSSFFKER